MHGKSIWIDFCLYLSISVVPISNVKAVGVPSASLFCGDVINGSTFYMTSMYYTFINNLTNTSEPGVYVQFSTCGSSYDTKLYLYDSNWTQIAVCDDKWDSDCSSCDIDYSHAQLITHTKLNDTLYFLEITSYLPDMEYGAFQLQIDCDFDYSFAPMPTPYPTRIALNASCAVENHQYICECTDYQCKERRIFCLDDMDCHLKCIGKSACDDAVVVWPKNGTGSIECNGPWACAGVTFPQPLSNHSNESYVIECDHEGECAFASIICPQTADCHVKCIGKSACDDAVVVCPQNTDCRLQCSGDTDSCAYAYIILPINGTTTVECNDLWACHSLEPSSNVSSISNVHYVVECHNCVSSTVNCPVHAPCTVICYDCFESTVNCPIHASCTVECVVSGSSCHLTEINWSSQFVKSDLICLQPSACASATQLPPKLYEYHFDKSYNVSQKVSERLQITDEFQIAFVMNIDALTEDSTYSLISIENEGIIAFKLWLHTDRDPNLFEIEFDDDDVVFFLGSEHPLDDQLDHYFVIHKTDELCAFAMDGIYFKQLTTEYANPLASSYSMEGRNNSFLMHLGDNDNPQIEAHIHNITIVIDLYQYYQTEDTTELSYVCFEQVKKYYVGMQGPFTLETEYNDDFYDDFNDTTASTVASTLLSFYLPIVAHFNGTIFMFDGYQHNRLYYDTFEVDDLFDFKWVPWVEVHDHALKLALFSQSWTQVHDTVYFIGTNQDWIATDEPLTKVIVELDLIDLGNSGYYHRDSDYLDMWNSDSLELNRSDMFSAEASTLCHNITHLYHIYKAIDQTIHIYNIANSTWTHSNESVVVSDSTNCQIYQPSQIMYLFGGRIHNGTHYTYSDRIFKYDILQDTVYSVLDTLDAPTINIKSLQKGTFIYLLSGSYFNDTTSPVQIFNITSEIVFVAPDRFSANIDSYYHENKILVFGSDSMYYYHDDIILFDFSNSSGQTTVPGDSATIFVDISGCSLDAVEDAKRSTYSFSFTSENAAVGIQSIVIIENGACTQICDAYSICDDCKSGLNPIISANADVESISISIKAHDNNGNVKLATDTIRIYVSECPVGLGIEPDGLIIDCNECSINTFKITTGNLPCYACPINNDGFHCEGSSVIHIQYNYWLSAFNSSSSQFISPFDIDLTPNDIIYSLHAVQCAPNYCCQSAPHCDYLASFTSSNEYNANSAGICAINRDSSTPLCARCVAGSYELFGSVQCKKCTDRMHLFLLLPIVVVTALFVIFLLFSSKPQDLSIYTAEEFDLKLLIRKDETQAVSILIMKVMIYYYQTLSQILGAKSVSHFLLPLLTIFNFSFENNSSSALGFCVFPRVSSPLLKLILSSLTPILCIGFNLFWIVIAWTATGFSDAISLSERNRMVFVVILNVITITAGTLLSLGFRLLSCITLPGTNVLVHYYDATSSCHDEYWLIGLVMVIAVSVLFIVIFIQIRRQPALQNPNHIYYQFTKPFTSSCWYFEFVLFIRRLIIASLTSFRISNSNDLDILLQTTLASFFGIECFMKPFNYHRLNVMEACTLLSLIAVISAISRNGESDNDAFIQFFVALAILIPFCICIVYIAKAIKTVLSELSEAQMKEKKIKLAQRAPTQMVFVFDPSGEVTHVEADELEAILDETNVLDGANIEMGCVPHVRKEVGVLEGPHSLSITPPRDDCDLSVETEALEMKQMESELLQQSHRAILMGNASGKEDQLEENVSQISTSYDDDKIP